MRSLQESRPNNLPLKSTDDYNQEFQRLIDLNFGPQQTNPTDTDNKFKDITGLKNSPEDQLFYSLLINQNPLQAVGSVAISAINALETEPDTTGAPESAIDIQQVDFWLWEREIADLYPESATNFELSAIGNKLDSVRSKILNDQSAEQWYNLKKQVAELKILPESQDKKDATINLNNQVDIFIISL